MKRLCYAITLGLLTAGTVTLLTGLAYPAIVVGCLATCTVLAKGDKK